MLTPKTKQTEYGELMVATFDCDLTPSKDSNLLNLLSSHASDGAIENLSELVPEVVDKNNNIDLLGVAFNAAVVNEFNKNHDGISTASTLECIDRFKHKPLNLEHDQKRVVGHIINAEFSDFDTNEVIKDRSEIDPLSAKKINIACGGVVYKTVNSQFSELLERSFDENDPIYRKISASWEMGFREFDIALGGENVASSVIVSDPDEVEELKPYLSAYGGKGCTPDGWPVRRLIKGSIYPLGVAFTMKPAGSVSGVVTKQDLAEETQEDEKLAASEKRKEPKMNEIGLFKKISTEISQKLKNTVNKSKTMELEELLTKIKASMEKNNYSEEAVASMTSTFEKSIQELNKDYVAKLQASETEKKEIALAKEELLNSVEELKAQVSEQAAKIAEFESKEAEAVALATYNSRMEEIGSVYELSEADQAFVAGKIKGLEASEEAFASFKDELAVFWANKTKEAVAKAAEEKETEIKEAAEKMIAEASVSEEDSKNILAALNKASASTEEPVNAPTVEPESMKERFAKAFAEEEILQK
jgi:hypothetical protein